MPLALLSLQKQLRVTHGSQRDPWSTYRSRTNLPRIVGKAVDASDVLLCFEIALSGTLMFVVGTPTSLYFAGLFPIVRQMMSGGAKEIRMNIYIEL